ncbi:DUF167 domain-containing protein [Humisphaera borealis]|uniref:UPF0235 protein IPV69_00260 n=1 Tax=Humisphaera borealis TaxID=2807512 RepID=A0A7M2WWR3_9BACT|nr:DUF167 domain-containing protein [Humisphaera borealis]QOV89843.1 DUF167 domain-containing protein [Humisphaera borealis]
MATLNVKVVPGASRDRVAGRYGDGVKVQVSAPPEDGKANKAVIKVLADFLGIRPDHIQISRGHTQPRKVVAIEGMDQATLDGKLAGLTN